MLKNISWEKLTDFDPNTNHKNRPIIIVDLDDNLCRKYNAIVVKYDKNKNVHVRYLDNPFYENKYWWTGNKDGLPGLNPSAYCAEFLGDDKNDMEGLKKDDFQEDGYDDIINFEKEPHRFFRSMSKYPFLDGVQGNVHVYNYYTSNFNMELSRGGLPDCIKKNIKLEKPERMLNNYEDILFNILEILPYSFSPIVKEYHKFKGNPMKEVEILKNFKKNLSLIITYQFIRKYKDKIKLLDDEIINIKSDFKKGYNNPHTIKILPFIINFNIIIFDCKDGDFDIQKYIGYRAENRNIYILKYMNKYDNIC